MSVLVNGTSKIAKKTKSLAKVSGNNDLLAKVDYSKSEIMDGSDQETLDLTAKILNAAQGQETLLKEGYNLKDGEIAKLEEIKAEINSLLDRRTTGASGSKQNTANLSEAIKGLRLAWALMDDLIEGIIDDEDFN